MLQGTLDNFALDEVLGLLAATQKTGKLEVAGDRGLGSLLFKDGAIVSADVNSAAGHSTEDVMFELLRFSSGEFTFAPSVVEASDGAEDMDKVLAAAEARLQDWKEIAAVVPSLNHIVTPTPELPEESITINRSEWAVLNVIAAGCRVSRVCDDLALGEVEGSRSIKRLAERSLVLIGEPVESGRPAATSEPEALAEEAPAALSADYFAVEEEHVEAEEEVSSTVQDMFGSDDFEMEVPPSLSGLTRPIATEEDDVDTGEAGGGVLKRYLGSSE